VLRRQRGSVVAGDIVPFRSRPGAARGGHGIVAGSTELERDAVAIRIAPGVRNEFAALAPVGEALLGAGALRRGNDVRPNIQRLRLPNARKPEREAEKHRQPISHEP